MNPHQNFKNFMKHSKQIHKHLMNDDVGMATIGGRWDNYSDGEVFGGKIKRVAVNKLDDLSKYTKYSKELSKKQCNNMGLVNWSIDKDTFTCDNIMKSKSELEDSEFAISSHYSKWEPHISLIKSDDEIDITAEGNKLTISGKIKSEQVGEYLHKGIGNRDFSHEFTLTETVIVRSADIENGLLIIQLENIIPEEKLPRKILIGGKSKLVIEDLKEAA